MFPLLTKANILRFCRKPKSESYIFRYFGIKVGDQINERYKDRYFKLRFNLMKKGYLTESDGQFLTVKGKHVSRNTPSPVEEDSVATL